MLTSEQIMASHKANIETLFGLTHKAFEGVEKLVELNVQATKAALAVSSSLFGQWLNHTGLQSQQFLRVFDIHHGLCVIGAFSQGRLGGLYVQFDQLFNAFKGFVGQTKQGFDVGFVGGDRKSTRLNSSHG